jgi:tetratricopeptide (TPR) repeat protein
METKELYAALQHTRLNRIFAIGVLVVSWTAFLMTVAPTVCFWDCGEYVAAGVSLAVPHPPGNPLFVMLARVVSLFLVFINDVGLRLNLVSTVATAFMAMFIYLTIVRAFVGWIGVPDTGWKRVVVYVGGVVGGLFAAFGSTVWFSAVESEVNATVLVPIAACTWLILVWAQSTDPRRDRILVLITYLAFLGIGIHMFSMITLGPLFLYVLIVDPDKRKDWRLWVTGVLMGLVMYDISWFIWAGSAAALISLVMAVVELKNRVRWQLCFYIALFGLVGYSTHIYIPIRSSLEPMIDENHPVVRTTSAWPFVDPSAFISYLQRKQYGSESMISRMFWRRGSFEHQFGIEGHMGFGGFWLTQFYRFSPLDTERSLFTGGELAGWGKLFVYLLPLFFIMFGAVFLFKKNRPVAILMSTLLLTTTIALVFYHNFSDGTRSEKRDYLNWEKNQKQGPQPLVHREVRVRDYFYCVGFMYYGMWVGIAAGGLLFVLYTNRRKVLRTTIAPICSVLFAASPALPLSQNMPFQTRRGDFVPFNYAYNLLMSCEKDGILFTNGDNDTFPLWALQEAYGIRRDVRVVNLSLLNTKWYIKQLKKIEPQVRISFTDKQIEELEHGINPYTQPFRYQLPEAGITVDIPSRKELYAMRIQDLMVVNIADAAKWIKPVYFAVTVSDDNLMGLGPYLQMEGLVQRLVPTPVNEAGVLNLKRTLYLLDHVYRFSGLGDGSTPLNETSEKLLTNYAASYIQIALQLRKPLLDKKAEIDKAQASAVPPIGLEEKKREYADTLAIVLSKLDQCVAMIPWDWRPRVLRHELLVAHGRAAEAEKKIREALKIEPENPDYLRMLLQVLEIQGKKKEAGDLMRKMVESNIDSWETYLSTAQSYMEMGAVDSAIMVMEQFSALHPDDRRAPSVVAQLRQFKKQREQAAVSADSAAGK